MGLTVEGPAGAWRPAGLPDASLDLGVVSTLPALERLVPEWAALCSRAEKHSWSAADRVLLRLDLSLLAQPRSGLRRLPCGLDGILPAPEGSMRPA